MSIILLYLIVALSVSLTSFITIYMPSVALFEEITENERTLYRSTLGKFLWLLLATIAAPLVALALLRGKNEKLIADIVTGWVQREEDE